MRLLERALNAALSAHVVYGTGKRCGRRGSTNRTGHTATTVPMDEGRWRFRSA
jgi:hypothetical protein